MSLFAFHQSTGFTAELWYTVYDDATASWGPDKQVPNVGMADSPSPVIWNGDLHVFHQGGWGNPAGVVAAQGQNFQLWFLYFDGTNWQPDTQVPNVGISTAPSAIVGPDGNLYVFHQGAGVDPRTATPTGELWYSAYVPGSGWQPDTQVPNVGMSESPSAVIWNGRLHVFYQGGGEDGQLWFVYFDGTNWQPAQQVPNVGMSQSPSAVVYDGNLYVFHQGAYDDRQLWYSTYVPGSGWQPDTQVPNVGMGNSPLMSNSPSTVVRNGDLFVFYLAEIRDPVNPTTSYQVQFSRFDGTNWYTNNPVPTIAWGPVNVNGVEVISLGINGSPGVVSTG